MRGGYNFDQSPFYCLNSKRKLAKYLNVSLPKLDHLANRSDNYNKFPLGVNGKARLIEHPKPELLKVQVRTHKLLQRISPPPYLHSSVIGRSFFTNAKKHVGPNGLANIDIKKFYPSTSSKDVFSFFRDFMLCSEDISSIMTKLLTTEGRVPTGAPHSQVISFYANYNIFTSLHAYAIENRLSYTVYVDDLTFSGCDINQNKIETIKDIIQKGGLPVNQRKITKYNPGANKLVTGLIVNKNGVYVPNKTKKEIVEEMAEVFSIPLEELDRKRVERLAGKLNYASGIDHSLRKRAVEVGGLLRTLNSVSYQNA